MLRLAAGIRLLLLLLLPLLAWWESFMDHRGKRHT